MNRISLVLHGRGVAIPLVVLLVLAVLFAGCPSILFRAEYQSSVRLEPMSLRTSVTVLSDPGLRKEWTERNNAEKLETIRQSLQDSLRADLLKNGPLTPNDDDPDAHLVITIRKASQRKMLLWVMMWFLAPIWLFGVPMDHLEVELTLYAELTTAEGDVIFRSAETDSCHLYQGLYYGYRDLSFGCPAQRVAERLRERLSLNRAGLLAKATRRRAPIPAAASLPVPPLTPGSAPVAVVFRIRDMSGRVDETVIDQLTEYLAAQLAQQLGYRVTPPDQLRAALADAKSESFRACYDQACQIELGKALAAHKTISTTLIRIGKRCALNTSIFDLKTEATDRAASSKPTDCTDENLLDSVTEVVGALSGKRQ